MSRPRSTFEGREVIENSIVISGVSASTDEVDPFYVGDTVFLVCEVAVERIEHQGVKGAEKVKRIARGRAIVSAVVDHALVQEAIELARIAQEARDGVMRLGFDAEGGE